MAVIQISKIQVRSGLQQDLPQLSTGEFGWSIDERRLFIGNGTLQDGAPEIGNTEILTIYSPIGAALSNIAILESNIATLQSQVAALTANATTLYTIPLADNVSTYTNIANLTFSTTTTTIDYSVTRGTSSRVGKLQLTQINNVANLSDDYSEIGATGVTLNAFAFGNSAIIQYKSSSTGFTGNISYYPPRIFA